MDAIIQVESEGNPNAVKMFLIIQKYYNPENSIEKAIRLWNGGVKYTVRATNRYYKKVLAQMK